MTPDWRDWRAGRLAWAAAAVVVAAQLAVTPASEPFFQNDETRHVMTGVFVRDALSDLPASAADPKGYAVRYYGQYPALGLLAWPPFFYLVEGAAMALFGASFLVARLTAAGFGLLAAAYLYRLAARTHGPRAAAGAVWVLGFCPLVFWMGRQVMLEIPTLAMVLGCVFHFERYVADRRPRDAVLTGLFAALALLTRFDGVVLVPYVLIRLASLRAFGLLLRPPVVLAVVLAAVLAGPYYLFTWAEYGATVAKAASEGTSPDSTGLFDPRNLYYYPGELTGMFGWAAAAAALLGLWAVAPGRAAGHERRAAAGPWVALIAATYLTFTPLAEVAARHAIYWLPGFAVLAADGVRAVGARLGRRAGVAAGVALAVGVAAEGLLMPRWYVRGYEPAARYVAARASGDRPVLIEATVNGGFIFHLRRADPGRRLWVVRGDKLVYAVLSDPHAGYEEFAKSDEEMLARVHAVDPEFLVVEEPQVLHSIPAGDRFRAAIRAHPDRFRLEHVVPLDTNHHWFAGGRLEVYRKLDRNPSPTPALDLPVLGLGRTLSVEREPGR